MTTLLCLRKSSTQVTPWLHQIQIRYLLTIKKTTRTTIEQSKSIQETKQVLNKVPKTKSIDPLHLNDSILNHQKNISRDKISTVRLAKRIAMAGICSRREAEKHIQKGIVTVNGQIINEVATTVDINNDIVAINHQILPKKTGTKIWMANKLKGELVTLNDPQNRPTIFDRLKIMGLSHHLMPIGRLDFNTEGLLLLTNDGDLARELEHPSYGVLRVYRALVRGEVTESKIADLAKGPIIKGIKYKPIQVTIQSNKNKDTWLQVKVAEGKNREVRNALAYIRLVVKRLIRIHYGPYRLADLPPGAVLEVKPKQSPESSPTNSSKN